MSFISFIETVDNFVDNFEESLLFAEAKAVIDVQRSKAEGVGRALRGIEWPNATRRATHSDLPAQKRWEPATKRLRFTDT